MVHLTSSERRLIDDLLECIAIAVEDVDDVNLQYANKTKLQKLLYLAIDEFDLPVTYSWYLAGTVVPGDTATLATLTNAFSDVAATEQPSIDEVDDVEDSFDPDAELPEDPIKPDHPEELPDAANASIDMEPILKDFLSLPTSEEPETTSGSSLTDFVDDRELVIDFYRRILPDVWYQQTMRFLQNFYRQHVPPEYRSLYLTSIHLRTHLLDAEESIRATLEGNEPPRSLEDIGRAIRLDLSDFHYQLRENQHLASTVPSAVRGTNVIEGAFDVFEQFNRGELTPVHLTAVQAIQEFFFYHVWRYPCLIISRETATGPRAQELAAERSGRLATFETELQDEIDATRRTLESGGLFPAGEEDMKLMDDEISRHLESLAEEYLQQ